MLQEELIDSSASRSVCAMSHSEQSRGDALDLPLWQSPLRSAHSDGRQRGVLKHASNVAARG